MKFQVSDGEKYQKIMEVEIPAEEMELPIKFACKRLADKVNIPGFRKGKVPRSVLESFLGIEAILEEAADGIIPKAYLDGLKETGLQPCTRPDIEVTQLKPGEAMCFKATVTVPPEITLGQYKGLNVTRHIMEITDELVDQEIENQRNRMAANVDAPEGAEAKLGDTVVIDFKGMKDGVAFDGGFAENFPLELGSGSFIPGFEDQLVGVKVGDETFVDVTFPDDYGEKSLAGQQAIFEIKVRGLKNKALPDLDQNFVETVSETAENIEQLREEFRSRLSKQAEDIATDTAKKEVTSMVINNCDIDLPDVMIEQEISNLIEDAEHRMMQQGLSLQQYLDYTGGNLEDMRNNYRNRAEFSIKHDLVLGAIVKAENIEASDDDIDEQLQVLSASYYQSASVLREQLIQNNRMEDFRYRVQLDKAMKLIYDNATVTDEIVDAEKLREQAQKKNVKEAEQKVKTNTDTPEASNEIVEDKAIDAE